MNERKEGEERGRGKGRGGGRGKTGRRGGGGGENASLTAVSRYQAAAASAPSAVRKERMLEATPLQKKKKPHTLFSFFFPRCKDPSQGGPSSRHHPSPAGRFRLFLRPPFICVMLCS